MPQPHEPDASEPLADAVVDQAIGVGQAPVESNSGEIPAAERFEFSQRLASFGLGESPDPLLKPAKPHGPRRPRRM
jgi:hypothetical protein